MFSVLFIRYNLFITWRSRWKTDGLNNVADKYQLVEKQEHKLYTTFLVDVGKPPDEPPIDKNAKPESLIWYVLGRKSHVIYGGHYDLFCFAV